MARLHRTAPRQTKTTTHHNEREKNWSGKVGRWPIHYLAAPHDKQNHKTEQIGRYDAGNTAQIEWAEVNGIFPGIHQDASYQKSRKNKEQVNAQPAKDR